MPNLRGFPAFTNDDLASLPIVFSALDALCFATDLCTPASLVLEAGAVGTSLVAVGGEPAPDEIGGRGSHVPADIDAFGFVNIPVAALESALDGALAARGERGGEAGGVIGCPSWYDVADETLSLLARCGSPRASAPGEPGHFPPVFTQMLTPHSAGPRSATFDMVDGTLRPINDGLLRDLGQQHADIELELIRGRIDQSFE